MAEKITNKSTRAQKPRKRPGRKLSATTQFVLSQARDMPAIDVVKAAAAQKIDLTAALVHKIRSRYKGPLAASSVHGKNVGSPRTEAGSVNRDYPSASAFVREQPLNRPVNEVVTEGAKLGLKVNALLVRVVRSKMRHAGDAKSTRAVRRRGRPPAAVTRALAGSPRVSGVAETQLRSLVIQLGTARAKALVDELERGIEALIAGR